MKYAKKRSFLHWRHANDDSVEFTTPFGRVTSLARQASCKHDWHFDGQTMTAVRWTCSKCFKTKMVG